MDVTKFNDVLRSTHRKGIEDLITFLNESDFFTAPCSVKFHLACKGGLASHTVNVLNCALKLNQSYNLFTTESIIIAATNNQRMLDKALFRRFDDVLHYSLPTEQDIYKLIVNKLSVFSSQFIPSKKLIEKSVSLSHAEISRICDDAIKQSILNDTNITQEDLLKLVDERLAVYTKEVR